MEHVRHDAAAVIDHEDDAEAVIDRGACAWVSTAPRCCGGDRPHPARCRGGGGAREADAAPWWSTALRCRGGSPCEATPRWRRITCGTMPRPVGHAPRCRGGGAAGAARPCSATRRRWCRCGATPPPWRTSSGKTPPKSRPRARIARRGQVPREWHRWRGRCRGAGVVDPTSRLGRRSLRRAGGVGGACDPCGACAGALAGRCGPRSGGSAR